MEKRKVSTLFSAKVDAFEINKSKQISTEISIFGKKIPIEINYLSKCQN